MDNAKIQFSADELRLVTNAHIILTKNRIIEKTAVFLGLLANCYQMAAANNFTTPGISQHPKIARGENYSGLPYVLLDYPRHFTKDDIFAIRTMFWWGNDFSITLHLKGSYKTLFETTLIKNMGILKHPGWYVQSSGNEWQHHYNIDTHKPFSGITADDLMAIFEKTTFIKIVLYFPLQNWNAAGQLFFNGFLSLLKALDIKGTKPPNDEIILLPGNPKDGSDQQSPFSQQNP